MSLSRRSLLAAAAGAFGLPEFARAEPGVAPSLVELFTSQGCSSCPAADALLMKLAQEPDVVALTFPVEIWDYLGWRDTLARPAFTRRQKAYARNVADNRVYTPQAVVNGGAACVGSDPLSITKLRASTQKAGNGRVRLKVQAEAEGWRVHGLPGEGRLLALPLATRETVKIGRGENSGRTLTYVNVVREIIDLGPSTTLPRDGAVMARARLDSLGANGVAFLVQQGGIEAPGAILACALADGGGVRA